ncbi:MAG TPA: hypothetical protein VF913_09220 [Xanthobacteraceae bacterium]
MAIAVNLALGLADLPAVQSLQGLREKLVESVRSMAQPSGEASRAAGRELLGEVVKVSS